MDRAARCMMAAPGHGGVQDESIPDKKEKAARSIGKRAVNKAAKENPRGLKTSPYRRNEENPAVRPRRPDGHKGRKADRGLSRLVGESEAIRSGITRGIIARSNNDPGISGRARTPPLAPDTPHPEGSKLISVALGTIGEVLGPRGVSIVLRRRPVVGGVLEISYVTCCFDCTLHRP